MRLFLAVELPGALRRALAEVQESLRRSEEGWRWVRPEGLHVTLRFLGEVAQERVPALSPLWRAAAAAAAEPEVEVGGLGTFPPRGRPRVLWVGLRDRSGGNLAALAAALEEAARGAGFTPEQRAFAPHLTLARAASGAAPRRPGTEVGTLGAFPAGELTLFRSVPGRGGAVYTALERYPLRPVN
ncbi:MAG TPA: RNA 2',3'-cyclic phosphodiesterase [Candidatus Polarisedimenticolaceae bacterium]|nr:RNA 2',3'-cyclic phosphodiesterase [Candidatus Polarisedimenticolaceae bacterium]